MHKGKGDAPEAVTAASGAIIAPVKKSSTRSVYAKRLLQYRRILVIASGPQGCFWAADEVGETLLALVARGSAGLSVPSVDGWSGRLYSYCRTLQRDYELKIETVRKDYESGGWHLRYHLVSPVSIVGCVG